jgi:hypothetical protein
VNARAAAPWAMAALGFSLAVCLFAPGWLSWDGAYQWKQARTGAFDSTHPPLLTLLWHWIEPHWSGPGSMLVLQQGMIWAGLAGIAASLNVHWGLRALLVLAIGLWPPLLLLSAHIFKDIPMLGAFALAVWMLCLDLRHPSWRLRIAALLLLLLACACRHNAVTGALPLLTWIVWRSLTQLPRVATRRPPPGALARGPFSAGPFSPGLIAVPVATVMALGLHALAQLPNLGEGVKNPQAVWSVVALWDMAAVSLVESEMHIPKPFQLPGARVEAMRPHFNEWTNTTLFLSGQLSHTLWQDFPDENVLELRQAWFRLPLEHPGPYFAHRLRLAALLFGFDNAALPDHQVLMMGFVAMEGNPSIEQVPNAWRQAWIDWGMRNTDGPFFMGWLYLLLAAGTAIAAVPGCLRDQPHAALAAAVAASSLAYALPLVFVSGSAEFRYLAWPIQAALLAPALLWVGHRASEHPVVSRG